MNNIKKYLIGGVLVVAFVLYLAWSSSNNSSQLATNNATTTPTTPVTNPTTTDPGTTNNGGSGGTTPPTPTSTPTPTPTPAPAPAGQYKDGSYTGPVTDAVYGSMQVKAVISGGKLTDVQFLQYPNDPGHTTDVSNQALPQLKQEAIAAQSANVNVVSGATQDSEAFQQSLGAALAMAKN